MKKLKFSFGEGGIRGWLIRHVEKVVLGVVLVLVVYFIYQGATLEGFDPTPQDLTTSMTNAQSTMAKDHWNELQKELPPITTTPDVRVAENLQRIDPNNYREGPLDPTIVQQRTLRGDPVLIAPEQLEATAFHGPMLVLQAGSSDPFASDPPAEERIEVMPERQGQPIVIKSTGQRLDLSREAKKNLSPFSPKANGKAVVKGAAVVAVRCVVDIEKQMEAYRDALPEVVGVDARKDEPNYVYFYVEYEEFRTGTQPTGNWTAKLSKGTFQTAEAAYGGEHTEVVDANFIHEVLTRKIPPLLLVDPTKLGKHSLTKLRKSLLMTQSNGSGTQRPAEALPPEDDPLNPRDPLDPADELPGDEQGPEVDDSPKTEDAYKYVLLRFFHVGLKPGMSYRYRVSLLLEDPNNPVDSLARPDLRYLDNEARARLTAVRQSQSTSKTQYYRLSDWSDPSPVVSIPTYGGIFGGAITQGRSVRINDVSVKKDADTAKLLVVQWDDSRATRIPGEMRVEVGSTLDRTLDVNVLNPVTLQLRSILGHNFTTGGVVVDLRGGEPVAEGSEYNTPGEIAVFTPQGKMYTRNELDDMETYREELFLDATSTAAGGATGPGNDLPNNGGEDLLFQEGESGLFEREFGRKR
ncbi:MAG: hypothetical protein ACI9HK_000804 [Pirellulaceae bacterium]|jgi:hypothetical protein